MCALVNRTHLHVFVIHRFTKRKASFDPNVDEDATESSYSPYKCDLNTNENGCLTPSDSDEDFPDPFGSSQGIFCMDLKQLTLCLKPNHFRIELAQMFKKL